MVEDGGVAGESVEVVRGGMLSDAPRDIPVEVGVFEAAEEESEAPPAVREAHLELLVEPVEKLRLAAQSVATGDLDVQIDLLRADEFGPLIQEFNVNSSMNVLQI